MGQAFDVFISYRSCDLETGQALHDRLVAEGFKVWFDRARPGEDCRRLMPGCKWCTEIEKGCEKSRVILPVLTPDWKTSEWTRFETYGHEAIIPPLFRGEWEQVATPPLEPLQFHDLRAPDERAGREDAIEVDYRHVASYPAGLDASTPVARTAGQLVAGLCLWRAGDVAGSREHFGQVASA